MPRVVLQKRMQGRAPRKQLISFWLAALALVPRPLQAEIVPPVAASTVAPSQGIQSNEVTGGTRDNGAPIANQAHEDRPGASGYSLTPATCLASNTPCTCFGEPAMAELQKRLVEAEQCDAALLSTRNWVKSNFALATPVAPEPQWWQTWPAQMLLIVGGGVIGGLLAGAAAKR